MTKIFIDPGHGGIDSGAVYGYTDESDINLEIAFYLQYELHIMGFRTVLSRYRDEDMPLHERVIKANSGKADLFISIHCDAFHNKTVSGISTHIYPISSIKTSEIANKIQSGLINHFQDRVNRGVKKSDFYVLRKTKMPAVLIESEFLSNPESREFLRKAENKRFIAISIAKSINSIF